MSRIGVVGLGLIGGSLALRLVDAGCEVVAWNHRDHPYGEARSRGIVCVDSLEALTASDPEIIVLCNPLRAMPQVLGELSRFLDPSRTTLTDVGSVKAMVRRQVAAAGLADCYVGAHPMAGNERSGFDAADPTLFDGALWAVTVDGRTSWERLEAVASMITDLVGDDLIVVDDRTHDRAAAMISHMPHAVSTALINELCDDPDRAVAAALSAGSWRDMTRVALTDPARTRAMIEEDGENVELLLRSMAARLDAVADALHNGDEESLAEFFRHGQPFRDYRLAMRGRTAPQPKAYPGDDGPRDLTLDGGENWRDDLLRSAVRGERIRSLGPGRTAAVVSRPFA